MSTKAVSSFEVVFRMEKKIGGNNTDMMSIEIGCSIMEQRTSRGQNI